MPLLRRRLSLYRRTPQGRALKPSTGDRILVAAPSWIGDAIMMHALLQRLRQLRPHCRIDVLAPAWCAPLLSRMPEVAACIDSPFEHGRFDWGRRRALGRQLAAAAYDQAIVLPNSWKSALAPWFAGIPLRTGYHGESRYLLLNDRRRLGKPPPPRLVDRYAALAASAAAPPQDAPPPRLRADAASETTTRRALGLAATGAPAVFCPGAEYGPAKRWPAHHFAALAQQVKTHTDMPVWLIGAAKETAIGDEIVRLAPGAAINLCGRTTLQQAIDLIAAARAVVSNDSGLMHVAAALQKPLAAIFGSSSPEYTPPLSSRAKILAASFPCSPCFKRTCPLPPAEALRCLESVTPQDVLTALPQLTRATPDAAFAAS